MASADESADAPELPELATQRATGINPDAGDHPVTADPRALDAVERASRVSQARFPYLDARYGARGQAFTRSDGGWLVTLAEHDDGVIRQQVDWLAGILTARGMPRLVLEVHLAASADALDEALPSHGAWWAKLRAAGAGLAASRAEHVPDALFAVRARALDGFRGRPGAGPPDAAELLAAAVADERAGFTRAVPSLLGWLSEPGRFDDGWREALLAAAEAWRKA
jgi:hypothetical protein